MSTYVSEGIRGYSPSFEDQPARRVLFSPPPRLQDNPIPPVPPIPIRFRDPPPLQYRPPQDYAAGVFRPMDRPFPFENDLLAHRINLHRDAVPNANVPPTRNQRDRRGNMGLGGAVLSLNRQRQLEEENARMRREQEGGNAWLNFQADTIGILRRIFMGSHGEGWRDGEQVDLDVVDGIAMSHFERAAQEPRRHGFGTGADRLQRINPVEYRSVYTHSRPEPGFSNDFAPADVIAVDQPGPSSLASSEAGTILVCAKCLDPLVMNVSGSEDVARRCRLWALRCGHMLDGKCVEELMKPIAVTETITEVKAPSDPSGSHQSDTGKETGATEGEYQDTAEQTLPPRRDKGKRKAAALGDNDSYVPIDRKGKGRAHDALIPNVVFEGASEGISSIPASTIRSRLRPRKSLSQSETSTTETNNATETNTATDDVPSSAQVQDDEETTPAERVFRAPRGRRRIASRGRAPRRRMGGPAKGKGKAKAPIVQGEHEWLCPVSTCQHKHWSVLIDGVWKMDDERELGAVALYV